MTAASHGTTMPTATAAYGVTPSYERTVPEGEGAHSDHPWPESAHQAQPFAGEAFRRDRHRSRPLPEAAAPLLGLLRVLLEGDLTMCRFMDFIRPHTARANAAKTMKPADAGGDLVLVDLLGEGNEVRQCRLALISGIVADAREEVVLGEGGVDQRGGELVLLGRPDLLLDLHGTLNQPPSGSICVACAISALSRISKKSAHGTCVDQRALGALELAPPLRRSRTANSRPRSRRALCNASVLGRLKPSL